MFGIRDPGSEIRDPEKIHPGSRIPDPWGKMAPDPGSRIRIRNTDEYTWFLAPETEAENHYLCYSYSERSFTSFYALTVPNEVFFNKSRFILTFENLNFFIYENIAHFVAMSHVSFSHSALKPSRELFVQSCPKNTTL
jgi:hypothetical protein